MSVEAITWALNAAPVDAPHLITLLIGLANHADAAGRGAAPSQRRLAHYTRKKDRSVREDLAALEALGIIRRGDPRRVAYLPADRRPVVWDLAMERRRDTPADLDAGIEPRSGRAATALADIAAIEVAGNQGAVGHRSVPQRRPHAVPGGGTPPPGTNTMTSAGADREAVHRRRTKGLEEENLQPSLEAATRFLLELPDPWRIGQLTAARLAPAVVAAFTDGWTEHELRERLSASPGGVKSPGAVLRARLDDLPTRARGPARPVEWCGECASPRSRFVPQKDHPDRLTWCPRCHPRHALPG
jgi:hypothetical protein